MLIEFDSSAILAAAAWTISSSCSNRALIMNIQQRENVGKKTTTYIEELSWDEVWNKNRIKRSLHHPGETRWGLVRVFFLGKRLLISRLDRPGRLLSLGIKMKYSILVITQTCIGLVVLRYFSLFFPESLQQQFQVYTFLLLAVCLSCVDTQDTLEFDRSRRKTSIWIESKRQNNLNSLCVPGTTWPKLGGLCSQNQIRTPSSHARDDVRCVVVELRVG